MRGQKECLISGITIFCLEEGVGKRVLERVPCADSSPPVTPSMGPEARLRMNRRVHGEVRN